MTISRRKFLLLSGLAGGGLILGFNLRPGPALPNTVAGSFQPNAFLQITEDGRVIFQVYKAEMGQGVMSGLATLLAEELDYDPARMECVMAPVHPDYKDPNNNTQVTGGSATVAASWDNHRHAGAAARALLLAAAARQWGVEPANCRTDNGVVHNNQTKAQLTYQQLAGQAKTMGEPDYTLKSPDQYRWIGKHFPRLDRIGKSDGTALYGMDMYLPGMKTAVVVRPAIFGSELATWNPASVASADGVQAAFPIHSGIAIVADSYWQARKAAQVLEVSWQPSPLAAVDSASIRADQQRALREQDVYTALEHGDIDNGLKNSARTFSAEYTAPFAHHSPMEPLNATALVVGDRCEVWAGNQAPDVCRGVVAHFTGLARDNITINSLLMGGGFGRRGYPDFVGEAAAIAMQYPGVPVKLVWSREDDMQHDFYRPATLHRIEAALDNNGKLYAWRHIIVGASILQGAAVSMMSAALPGWVPIEIGRAIGKLGSGILGKVDPISAEGAKIPYHSPNLSVGQITHDAGIPTGFWRSVGFSHNCYVVESFIDELALAAEADPIEFRLAHLDDHPRQRAVLQLARDKAGWNQATAGIFQGVALSAPFKSHCAMVAEVSVHGREFQVERIVAAVDCGRVINPDIVVTQVEGAIVYALTAALKAPIVISGGAVSGSNFHDLPVMRMNEVPPIEVYLISSEEQPTGIGEIGVPAVAPAIANALYAATGQRLRELPLQLA